MKPIKIVIDTSVIIKWLVFINESHVDKAECIRRDLRLGIVTIYIPELCHYELGNALIKGKGLPSKETRYLQSIIYDLPLISVSENINLAHTASDLAEKCKISYYDAAFLALAKQLDATLVTDNIKHQGKALDINVIALKNYNPIRT